MIRIYKNPNGDTRTAKSDVSLGEFREANDMHREDIKNVMHELAYDLMRKGRTHDFTKVTDEKLFYKNFLSTMNNGSDFVNDKWYQMHIVEERHHLLSNCPENVNLLDVLEMISDCVCAGMARSGEVRPIEINDDILRKALDNTVILVKNMIEVVDNDTDKNLELIEWLKGEKFGYLLEDHKTWVNYGDVNDKFPHDESKKTFELSRNRMIDKTIQKINEILEKNSRRMD